MSLLNVFNHSVVRIQVKMASKYSQITLNVWIVHFTSFELEIFFGHLTLKAIKQARALDRQITHRIKLVKSVRCREP